MVPRIGREEFPEREHSVEPVGPLGLLEFQVTLDSISGRSRPMLWDDPAIVDIFVYLLHHPSIQNRRRITKLIQQMDGHLCVRSANFLLTLDESVHGSLIPRITARDEDLTAHQRELAYGKYRFRIRLIEQSAGSTIKHTCHESRKKSWD
jgi:hypothetical protein